MEATEKTTFADAQETARETTSAFFADENNARVLATVLEPVSREENLRLLAFYASIDGGVLYSKEGDSLVDLKAAYRTNLGIYKKRLFDFLALEGKGELWYKGERNPAFAPVSSEPGLRAPLAVLLAVRFLIMCGADRAFWRNKASIEARCAKHVEAKKKLYQENHRKSHCQLREAAQNKVKAERADGAADPVKTHVEFSRKERKRIQDLIAAEKEHKKKKKGGRYQNRSNKRNRNKVSEPVRKLAPI